jgi:hypothetical protein
MWPRLTDTVGPKVPSARPLATSHHTAHSTAARWMLVTVSGNGRDGTWPPGHESSVARGGGGSRLAVTRTVWQPRSTSLPPCWLLMLLQTSRGPGSAGTRSSKPLRSGYGGWSRCTSGRSTWTACRAPATPSTVVRRWTGAEESGSIAQPVSWTEPAWPATSSSAPKGCTRGSPVMSAAAWARMPGRVE